MIVSCPSCDSKYQVADDKVAGNVLRTRCKACGSQILVDGTTTPGPNNDEDEDDVTRIMRPGDRPDSGESLAPASGNQWTVHVGESDTRPMTANEIVQGFVNGTLGDDVAVWKSGMSNWASIADVPELMALIEKTGRRARPATDNVIGRSKPPPSARAAVGGTTTSASPRTASASTGPSRTLKPPPPSRAPAASSVAKVGTSTIKTEPVVQNVTSNLDPEAAHGDFYAKILAKVRPQAVDSVPPVKASTKTLPPPTWGMISNANQPEHYAQPRRPSQVPGSVHPVAASPVRALGLASAQSYAGASGVASAVEVVDIPVNVDEEVVVDAGSAQPSRQGLPQALVRRASPSPPKRPDPVIPVDIQLPPMDGGNAELRAAGPTVVVSASTPPPAAESKPVAVEAKSGVASEPANEVTTGNTSPGLRAYEEGKRRRFAGTVIVIVVVGLIGVGGGVAATVYMLKSSNKNPNPSVPSASVAANQLSNPVAHASASPTPASPSTGSVDADELSRSGPGAASAQSVRGYAGKRTASHTGAADNAVSLGVAPAAASAAAKNPVSTAANRDPNMPGSLGAAADTKSKTAKTAKAATAAPLPKEAAKPSGSPFNREAALAVLGIAASQAPSCKRPGGPTGNGRALVTFDSDGQVVIANIVGDDIAGTPVARCVASLFQRVKVAPFSGDRATVSKPFTIPP